MACLRKLSEFCDFNDTLKDVLRDHHLVCGCKDKRLQCKLLAEKDLTFDKALEMAKPMETAEKEAKDLQEPPTAPVNAIHGWRKGSPKKPSPQMLTSPQKATGNACQRCGGKHKAADCKF